MGNCELLKAELEVLEIELETVRLLMHAAQDPSPRRIAACTREEKLRREIGLLLGKVRLGDKAVS